MFTRFGGLSDARVKAQLAHGERVRALLVQPRFAPLRLADEVALAFALREAVLDGIPAEAVALFRQALPRWLDEKAAGFVQAIGRTRRMNGVDRAKLRQILSELAARYAVPAAP